MIFREAIRNGWADRNPARLIKAKKEDNARIRFLSDDEEKELRQILADDYQNRYLNEFEIALHTGMRRSEQFSLEWAQTDLRAKRIHLLKTKNGSDRAIPLNSVAVAALERQWHVSGQLQRVFVTEDGKPFIRKPIRRWFEEAIVKAGIRNFSWHCLRHTFCSRLVMAGVPLKTVQELMGHKTIQMTARYAHLAPEHLRSAVEMITSPQNLAPSTHNHSTHSAPEEGSRLPGSALIGLPRISPLLTRIRFGSRNRSKKSAPWVNDFNVQILKVSDVSGDDCEIVHQGSRCNESISNLQLSPLQFALACQNTPPFRNGFIDWKDPASEPWPQCTVEPMLKFRPAFACRKNSDPLQNLTKRNDAEVQLLVVGIFQPLQNAWLRLGAG
jgi:hypothetical protein